MFLRARSGEVLPLSGLRILWSQIQWRCYLNKDLDLVLNCVAQQIPLPLGQVLTMKFHARLHFSNQCLLSIYCVPSTVLDVKNRVGQGSISVLKLLLGPWIREIIWYISHITCLTNFLHIPPSNLLALIGTIPLHLRTPPHNQNITYFQGLTKSLTSFTNPTPPFTCFSTSRPIP